MPSDNLLLNFKNHLQLADHGCILEPTIKRPLGHGSIIWTPIATRCSRFSVTPMPPGAPQRNSMRLQPAGWFAGVFSSWRAKNYGDLKTVSSGESRTICFELRPVIDCSW